MSCTGENVKIKRMVCRRRRLVDTPRFTCPLSFTNTMPFCSTNRKKEGRRVAVPKMKAPRRASRPAGTPPNNIPAPYLRLSRTTIFLFLLLMRQQSCYYRLYEPHWSAGVLLYLLRGHERKRGRGKVCQLTETKKERKRRMIVVVT